MSWWGGAVTPSSTTSAREELGNQATHQRAARGSQLHGRAPTVRHSPSQVHLPVPPALPSGPLRLAACATSRMRLTMLIGRCACECSTLPICTTVDMLPAPATLLKQILAIYFMSRYAKQIGACCHVHWELVQFCVEEA